jgi:signal transduction histidine kinase
MAMRADRCLPWVTVTSIHLGPTHLTRLLESVISLGSEHDLERVLRRIVETGLELTGARYGALGVLDDQRRELTKFVTVGKSDEVRDQIGSLPPGLELLGAFIADARPRRVPDLNEYQARAGSPLEHLPKKSFVGVPIMIRDEVFGNLYLTDKQDGEVFTDIDEELILGLASAAGVAIDNARLYDRLTRREAALTAIQLVATSVLEGADTDQTLHFVAERARVLARADAASVALPADDGRSLVCSVAAGAVDEDLIGMSFPLRGSVSGDVLQSGETAVFTDLSRDARRAQPQVRRGRIGPAIFVALTVSGRPLGSLFVGRAQGAHPFAQADVDLVGSFAAQAGVVIDTATQRQQLGRLSVLEEQERIARDLHDTVIQQVFAVGLSLNSAAKLAGDHPVHPRIDAAIDDLDAVIRQLRTVIFDVGSGVMRPSADLRTDLLEQIREVSRVLGFDPKTNFEGLVDLVLRPEMAKIVSATLREALSNVARHAHASRVDISVTAGADRLSIRIVDDGVGVPAAASHSGGRGLSNMRARAEQKGGRFTLKSGPDGTGTALEWEVPVK